VSRLDGVQHAARDPIYRGDVNWNKGELNASLRAYPICDTRRFVSLFIDT
jgi:hypothetical protein